MISVVIPLYNKEPIIERSLRSVLSQDYEDLEVVVVNDCSTDKSADIVRSIKDDRIRLIDQENGGPSKARNTGVKYAKGDWIVFLDADDELLPKALKHFVDLIEEYPQFKMFGCSYITDNGMQQQEPYMIKEGYNRNCYKVHALNRYNYRTGCTIIKKEIAIACPFDEKLRRFEDLECYFRMHQFGGMYFDPTVVFKQNISYCEASEGRKEIAEDYVGHLSFENKSFWKTMSQYRLFIEERQHYPEAMKKLYPCWYKRVDLYLLYQLFGYLCIRT